MIFFQALLCVLAGAYACSAAGVDRQLKEGCGSRLAESSLKAVGPGHWDKVDETYAIQSPQGVPQGDRFSVSGSVYNFKVKKDDPSFDGRPHDDKGGCPRTEMRMCHCWSKGRHQFAANVTVADGTDMVNIAQIKVQEGGDPNTVELQIKNGHLYQGPRDAKLIAKNVVGRQFRLVVIHDAGDHKVTVRVDDKEWSGKDYWEEQGGLQYYFKAGVYASCESHTPSDVMSARFEGISVWTDKASNLEECR